MVICSHATNITCGWRINHLHVSLKAPMESSKTIHYLGGAEGFGDTVCRAVKITLNRR